jgi:hypothetical protein
MKMEPIGPGPLSTGKRRADNNIAFSEYFVMGRK